MQTTVLIIVVAICAIALLGILFCLIAFYRHANYKSATVEGKLVPDSRRIIWRIVNNGVRNVVIVEIGLKCGDKYTSYRPLFAQTEDINNIPQLIERGDIASYRKEMERFTFRQSETDELKISNPYLYFYAKDAEGTVYLQKSDYKFVQYLTMLIGPIK